MGVKLNPFTGQLYIADDSASATLPGNVELATNSETLDGISTDVVTTPANISAKLASPGEIGGTAAATVNATDVVVSGNVDGRDVSADGAKLDNIDENATADQTGSEIKSLYEAESDTNAYTDTEKSKLAGIADGATAIDLASPGEIGGTAADVVNATEFVETDTPANTPQYWWAYNSVDTRYELWSADGDGSGTDTLIWYIDDGETSFNFINVGEKVNALGTLTGGTDDIDLNSGNTVTATISTASQTFTFSNPATSGTCSSFTLYLINGGSQTITWPASVAWQSGTAPTLTSSGLDILVFSTFDAGITWYGLLAGKDMS